MAGGDENAFETIYRFYQPRLQRYIYPFTNGSQQDTEEVVQEVFVKLWLHREMLPAIESFPQYLFRMARNRLIDQQRLHQKNHSTVRHLGQSQEEAAETVTEGILLNDYKKIAREAIQALSPQKQNIFLLRYEHDKSLDDIAHELGITKTSVKNQLYKAVREVRESLQRRGGIQLPLILVLY